VGIVNREVDTATGGVTGARSQLSKAVKGETTWPGKMGILHIKVESKIRFCSEYFFMWGRESRREETEKGKFWIGGGEGQKTDPITENHTHYFKA